MVETHQVNDPQIYQENVNIQESQYDPIET